MSNLTRSVHQYHGAKCIMSRADGDAGCSAMHVATEQLFSGLREVEKKSKIAPPHSRSIYFTYSGSRYEKLQVGNSKENDFDVMMPLNANKVLDMDRIKELPGYVVFKPKDPSDPRWTGLLTEQGYLSPEKMMRHYTSKVDKIVPAMNIDDATGQIKRAVKGPAIQLYLPTRTGATAKVEVIPAYKFDEQTMYVAKPIKLDPDAKVWSQLKKDFDPNATWRESYSKHEKDMLQYADRGGGCRREILKVWKSIRNEDPTLQHLPSYDFKQVGMHIIGQYRNNEDWEQNKAGQRFKDYLGYFENTLRDKNLSNFFQPEINLYTGVSDVTLNNIHGRVRHLVNSPIELEKVLKKR